MAFELNNFLSYRENNRLEVKKAGNGLPHSLWESYSAMANCNGGIILLGVEELPDGAFNPVGLQDPDKLLKDLWNNINNPNKVSANLLTDRDVEILKIDGKTILALHIPMARREDKPVYINGNLFGGTFRRNGEGDYHCTQSEIKAMLRDQPERAADTKVLDDMLLSDLNAKSIQAYRTRFDNLHSNHVWNDLSDEEFLERLGAIRRSPDDKEMHPTGAGLLMFGNETKIRYEYPYYFLDYQEKLDPSIRWTDRVTSDSGDWSGNIFDFFFRISSQLEQSLKVPFKLEGITRIDDTPAHKALREALVNCLVNADYFLPHGVVIVHERGKITMSNPGAIRIGKSQMIHGGISDPRNQTIMKMFNLLRIGERAGSGVPDIYAVWKEQHWPTPSIVESYAPDRVELILALNSDADVISESLKIKVSNDINSDTLTDTLKKDEKVQTLLLLIQQDPTIKQDQLVDKTGYSIATVKRLMKKMQEQKLISREGSKKTGDWKITD